MGEKPRRCQECGRDMTLVGHDESGATWWECPVCGTRKPTKEDEKKYGRRSKQFYKPRPEVEKP